MCAYIDVATVPSYLFLKKKIFSSITRNPSEIYDVYMFFDTTHGMLIADYVKGAVSAIFSVPLNSVN